MQCGTPECVHDHVRPRLRQPRPNAAGNGYRAVATCHDDHERSLSVSLGGSGRVIWHCFAGCDSEKVHASLIRLGVPSRCLHRPAEDQAAFEEAVAALAFGKDSHAHVRLRLAAMLRGFGDELPRGAELAQLAEDCGVSLREAYKARGACNR